MRCPRSKSTYHSHVRSESVLSASQPDRNLPTTRIVCLSHVPSWPAVALMMSALPLLESEQGLCPSCPEPPRWHFVSPLGSWTELKSALALAAITAAAAKADHNRESPTQSSFVSLSPHFGPPWCRGLGSGLPMRRGSVPVDSQRLRHGGMRSVYAGRARRGLGVRKREPNSPRGRRARSRCVVIESACALRPRAPLAPR